ncbi:extracellular solute-binding protein [Microlunatus parietis]|uniref:Putative aldouronate transport system substrate-binding protein n=1 Tax=Microlunatus parietis TaxID=682979 RepID=A0A7Y9I3U7_9ACTN|nr:extracellular solute-binding protein [Microlunatus parietis]NYE69785.1 putative aldouronate transport system substrate-binding protein [Microlunatus parietis]
MTPAFSLSRRHLLAGGTAVAGAALLGGCASGSDTTDSDEANRAVTLPAYVPYEGVKPDLASTDEAVMPGFLSYPKGDVTATEGKPLASGKPLTILTNTNVQLPPPLAQNKYWQAINEAAGAELQFTMATAADYTAKLTVVIAGDDLPEVVALRPIGDLPKLLEARFTNLTEHLSGDAIKKYPNLANIPTISWRSCIFNGGIYGIPLNRPAAAGEMHARLDVIKARGANPEPKSYAEFLEMCRTVNDPKRNRYAMGSPASTINFLKEMLGLPLGWGVDDAGKFTHVAEREEFKQILDAVSQQWNEGLFHPDSFTQETLLAQWVGTGVVAVNNGGAGSVSGYYTTYSANNPDMEMGILVPPKWDGGGDGTKLMGPAIYGGPIAITKTTPERLDEILSFFNWLASPFGTVEHRLLSYGVEGHDFDYQDGDPVRSQTGVREVTLPVNYTGSAPVVNFTPGRPETTKQYHAYQERCAKNKLAMATQGLYSPHPAVRRRGAGQEPDRRDQRRGHRAEEAGRLRCGAVLVPLRWRGHDQDRVPGSLRRHAVTNFV